MMHPLCFTVDGSSAMEILNKDLEGEFDRVVCQCKGLPNESLLAGLQNLYDVHSEKATFKGRVREGKARGTGTDRRGVSQGCRQNGRAASYN